MDVLLLPSPLLGPLVWSPAAEALSRDGWAVRVASTGEQAPTCPDDVLQSFLAELPADRATIVVAHSNAGLFVPSLVQERPIAASVFVDAGLPVRAGAVPLAPAHFREFLAAKADALGQLPPWSHWWEESDLAGLFPSDAVREQVEREQPRLPLSYFEGMYSANAGWDDRPCAYLAFGDTYQAERTEAQARGWPVATLAGGHLHMLVGPDHVAGAITALLDMLGCTPTAPFARRSHPADATTPG
ncbi:MAG: hypothetical protein ABIM89_02090 [Mycobacteriales bacterium]